ncbi:MAG: hypothetical protein ACLQVI_20100 [Polyangiaceae bacterium]|jgi:hypothetical protein
MDVGFRASDSVDVDGAARPDQIEATLRMALGFLRAASPSPRAREYKARAESYRLTIERWKMSPPTDGQRVALGELVTELHEAVLASARRGSIRALAKSGDSSQ